MPARVAIHYKPQGDVLDAYVQCMEQRAFIMGPLGSGKTNGSCWKCFRVMTRQRPGRDKIRRTRIIVVRNTYSDLLTTAVKDWLEMFEDLGQYTAGGREPPTHHLDFDLPDGTRVISEMVFLALDREEDVKKLRGTQCTASWLNEVKELPFGILAMLDLRVGRYPSQANGGASWHGIFGDTNAPDTDHWYYQMAEEQTHFDPQLQRTVRGPEGWRFFKQPGGLIRDTKTSPWRPNMAAENLRNLPGHQEYYTKGAQGKGDDWIAVNLANEYGFVKEGKPCYPDYRDGVMCREFELVRDLGLWVGMDFGLTPAAVFGQRAVTGQWRIRHEITTEDVGVNRFAEEVNRFLAAQYQGWKINGMFGDPAGGQRAAGDVDERTVFQILAANDLHVAPAPGNNDITLRLEAFSSPMRKLVDGEPGILIHPECKVLRKACQGGYAFKRIKVVGTDRHRDLPDKNKYSHPADAGQYLLLGAGEGEVLLRRSKKTDSARKYREQRGLE